MYRVYTVKYQNLFNYSIERTVREIDAGGNLMTDALTKSRFIALGVGILLILAGFITMLALEEDEDSYYRTGDTIRTGDNLLIVSDDSPFYALVSTPVAMYYQKNNDSFEKNVRPLLVVNGQEPSTAIGNFLEAYNGEKNSAMVGEMDAGGYGLSMNEQFIGSLREISRDMALKYWESSLYAMIISPDEDGYNVGVTAVAIASYLNMPVLISKDINGVFNTLETLGVGTVYTCGDVDGSFFGEKIHLDSPKIALNRTLMVMEDHGLEVSYIALANPLDGFDPVVEESIVYDDFSGTVEHSETGSSANPGNSNVNAPIYYFEIPEDYQWARVTIDTRLEIDNFDLADLEGDRIYTYVGTDLDRDGVIINDGDSEDDRLNFMDPSLAYGYIQEDGSWWCHGHTFRPMYNAQGEHSVQVLASMPSRQHTSLSPSADFKCTITVEKLRDPHFPLMPGLSSLAPYLAAYREGVVLADKEYSVHANEALLELDDCGEPDTAMYLMEPANRKVQEIKDDLDSLLGELAGLPAETQEDKTALADHYQERIIQDPIYVGIIADTNMIPVWNNIEPDHYGYGAYEGLGVSGETILYGDIDTSVTHLQSDNHSFDFGEKDPDIEIPVGRIDGWDAQDVSALLARTFFYYDIIDSFPGTNGFSWKESAFAHFGSEPPVESSITVVERFKAMWTEAGFLGMDDPVTHSSQMGRRQLTQEYYERSNYHFFCAHGFFYWYVPTAAENLMSEAGDIIKGTAGGGAFTVASVKDMDMGPGTIFGSSCVTGKIDGIPGRNALSMAFLHAGMNVYIGASRLSYGGVVPVPDPNADEALGNYLGAMYYAYMSGGVFYDKEAGETHMPYEDLSSGLALMLAKNNYVQNKGDAGVDMTTYVEFMHHGDPAFNPYEPNHNG